MIRARTRFAAAVCAGLLAVGLPAAAGAAEREARRSGNWSDPSIWADGAAPGEGDDVAIGDGIAVTFDLPASPPLGRVEVDGELTFDADTTAELRLRGNLLLYGRLALRPASAAVRHTVTFLDVDESGFVGGGMSPVASDVGLWVMGEGRLDAVGADRTPWTRLRGAAEAGATVLEVEDAAGWRVGDRLVLTPTQSPAAGAACWTGYDDVRVERIDGNAVTLSEPLTHPHPQVNGAWTAEALNLTRNIVLRGTAEGRAHTLFMTDAPQTLRNVAFEQMGPRTPPDARGVTHSVLGRYPVHFHHCGDGSRGTLVENVVVHESGNRAFVPHASHGVTLRGCVSHDVWEDAYWWDPGPGNESHDGRWERCVASFLRADPAFRGYRLTGFNLRHGERNAIVDCVAVGVRGNNDASGFLWPEKSGSVWEFTNCVAHNNKQDGLFVWQNNAERHRVGPFLSYHNADNGLEHGAYSNSYEYRDSVLHGNGRAGVQVHAVSGSSKQLRFERLRIEGAGVTRYGLEFVKHQPPPGQPTWVEECTVDGVTDVAVAFTYDGPAAKAKRDWVDFVHCRFPDDVPQFRLNENLHPDTLLTVEPADGPAFQLHRPNGDFGEPVAEWNARRSALPRPDTPTPAATAVPSIGEAFDAPAEAGWGDGWTVVELGGARPQVSVEEGRGLVRSAGEGGVVLLSPTPETAADVEQAVTFQISMNVPRVGLIARWNGDADSCCGVRVGTGDRRTLEAFRRIGGATKVVKRADNPVVVEAKTDYRLRLIAREVDHGVVLQAKLWPADAAEPAEWTLETDALHNRDLRGAAGQFGVLVEQGGNSSRVVRCDDYVAGAP
ncbi:G8 domain-containing protein [Alienimonas sp. DA493]|uniref:G8 domain-containing protein n=1 Tax=Alienimonas sp. DA493 TaxID=3373605 RepID=UPI0037552C90